MVWKGHILFRDIIRQKTRSVAMVPYGFYEDLGSVYPGDYPEVESVYTMQVVQCGFLILNV